MAVISIVAIILIFWQVHDLLVGVGKSRGKGFNIPGTSFPTYKNGKEGLLGTKGMEVVDGSLPCPFYIIFILQPQSDRAIIMLFK